MLPRSRKRPPLGPRGEEWAALEYERRGCRVLARNVRNAGGEIDLLARDGATLVAVEVKTRTTHAQNPARFGSPAEAVDARRIARLSRALELHAAMVHLRSSGISALRIDVAEVQVDSMGQLLEIRILENVTK